MTTRRVFLYQAAVIAAMRAQTKATTVPKPIKAFCIDFNWRHPRPDGWLNDFARPGHWADASPSEHVGWYEEIGANVIQTFAVSCNGYSWYKGGFIPAQPALKHDFLPEVVELGHRKGMFVAGYFCAGANTRWGQDHPDLSYGTPSSPHIPFTDAYLDYLAESIADAIRRTGMDGYMIDWVWNPRGDVRRARWIPAEIALFEKTTGKAFPARGEPGAVEKLAYERAALERCWERIHRVTRQTRKNCVIWLSCSRLSDPTVTGSRMLREVDWVLNEAPDRELYESTVKMVGGHTRLIQCLVGWPSHDARNYLSDPRNQGIDLYGFAEPRDNSLPLSPQIYLHQPAASFQGDERRMVNDRNIAALARYYRGLPMDR